MTHLKGKIWIITGQRGVGKTRFCSNFAAIAREKRLEVKGVICPPRFAGDEKAAIDLIDLETGNRRTLARTKNYKGSGTVTDHWAFDEDVLTWSNQLLGKINNCTLVILDELGPLEFKFGKGWQNGLSLLDQGEFDCALAVIRYDLLQSARQRWPGASIMEIPAGLDASNEEKLQQKIFQTFL